MQLNKDFKFYNFKTTSPNEVTTYICFIINFLTRGILVMYLPTDIFMHNYKFIITKIN